MLTLTVPLSAQTFRGNILGTVTDPNGAVIPETTVTARNVGTGHERTTVTDSSGNTSIFQSSRPLRLPNK
ncbi:MAG: carboxypeptidase-like regulatory domain-containing protein [Pyrinomonadaceae bacterium]